MSKRTAVAKFSRDVDTPQFAAWMAERAARNLVDPTIFTYPATEILKAVNGVVRVYLPLQKVYFLESLAINPDNRPQDTAVALRELFTVICFEARCQGMGEIYWLCGDKETKQFLEHQEFEGMTPDPDGEAIRLYRYKL